MIESKTNKKCVSISKTGLSLLQSAILNKGTAFSENERINFNLVGLLPYKIENINDQAIRHYNEYTKLTTDYEKHDFLYNIYNANETLFYYLISKHLQEILPIIYTPTVSHTVINYNETFLNPNGLYISYPNIKNIKQILKNRLNKDIDIIVITDAEAILGIGDQGVGGISIPIAKLIVYTLCAGIDPRKCLPIILDFGTNNQNLIENKSYLGWKNNRIKEKQYDEAIDIVIKNIKKEMPKCFLHWEDFGKRNARKNLVKFRTKICSFNGDMQGTAAVTLAALISCCDKINIKFEEQKFVIFGAGNAGIGIADEIVNFLSNLGLNKKEIYSKIWCIDRQGLLILGRDNLSASQALYAHKNSDFKNWKIENYGNISFLNVIKNVKPTTLIGCSGVSNAFTDDIILNIAKNCLNPIIFTLSNPNSKCERHPAEIIKLTKGKALIATGSPYKDYTYSGINYNFSQANNALVFPGIGLGIVAIKAKCFTENMLTAAYIALAKYSKEQNVILPKISESIKFSKKIAEAVAKQGILDKVSTLSSQDYKKLVNNVIWHPEYMEYNLKL